MSYDPELDEFECPCCIAPPSIGAPHFEVRSVQNEKQQTRFDPNNTQYSTLYLREDTTTKLSVGGSPVTWSRAYSRPDLTMALVAGTLPGGVPLDCLYPTIYTGSAWGPGDKLSDTHYRRDLTADTFVESVFSIPYTFADVRDDIEETMPEYPEEAEAATSLSAANYHVGAFLPKIRIRRATYKLVHLPTASGYLKVWLRRETWWRDSTYPWDGPDGYDDRDIEDSTYEWMGDSRDHPPTVFAEEEDRIVGEEGELVAGENQWVTLSIARYSFLPSYTPTDLSDSGWPPG